MEKVYLDLERHNVNAAELAGASWDGKKGKWFLLTENLRNWKYPENLRNLKDDREYMGNLLCVDLIPNPCWGKNIEQLIGAGIPSAGGLASQALKDGRLAASQTKFDLLGNCVNIRVNYICEFCKTRTGLVTVGKWEYDESTKIRFLRRLIGLCGLCVDVTHIGRASIYGKRDEAINHLKNVRNFTQAQANQHIHEAFNLWRIRNEINWYSDISILDF